MHVRNERWPHRTLEWEGKRRVIFPFTWNEYITQTVENKRFVGRITGVNGIEDGQKGSRRKIGSGEKRYSFICKIYFKIPTNIAKLWHTTVVQRYISLTSEAAYLNANSLNHFVPNVRLNLNGERVGPFTENPPPAKPRTECSCFKEREQTEWNLLKRVLGRLLQYLCYIHLSKINNIRFDKDFSP